MKKILASIVLLCFSCCLSAQDSTHLRISLLTVGPGHQEIYEPFGHTAVRIIDSVRGTDIVYNYGTFNGYEENFELKFMRGKLLYYLSVSSFPGFMQEYVAARRSVQEQVLTMDAHNKQQIQNFLSNNLKPENRSYKYDFFFDNCSTRIRDVFPRTFGDRFRFAQVLPKTSRISFRDIMNDYLYKEHLYRLGINLLLGSPIDQVMDNKDIMFLPDFLRDGLAGATVDGKAISGPVVTLLPGKPQPAAGIDEGLLLTLAILILTVLGMTVKPLQWLGKFMSSFVLLVSGLLGVLMLVMWFGTDHQACQNNWNILWALPTNLLLLLKTKKANRYAVVALLLIFVSLVLHITRVQQIALRELWPFLLCLLFVYGMIYRKSSLRT